LVILKNQADLSAAANIAEVTVRREFVYHTLVDHAFQTQADLRAELDRRDLAYQPYYLVNAIEVENGPLLRRWLANRPDVDRVLDNPILRPLPKPLPLTTGSADPPSDPDWNLTLIGADQVWREFDIRGEGVVIGQSDSGVDWRHPELQPSYRGHQADRGQGGDHTYNWLDPWNQTPQPTDIGGHGTHTLGSIVGQTVGVAPGATWFACANLPRNLGNPALYLTCMQFMLAPYPLDGDPFRHGDPSQSADVVNNSWGCPDIEGCDPTALLPAVQALRTAGIFVVASAGNEGPNCESINDPPAIYDESFSVGAIGAEGELAFFSSLGPVSVDGSNRPKPDIVAPGSGVLSAFPGGTYEFAGGTSMAGPHVAGVVALVWSANSALIGQIDQTEAILRQTTTPYTGPPPNCGSLENAVGVGIVNAYEAVKLALGR
jgi:subtilisin family serine protease